MLNKNNKNENPKYKDKQLLTLEERKLNLREWIAKVHLLEFQNMQLENELNGSDGWVGN